MAECVLQMPGRRHIPRAVRHNLAMVVEGAVHGRPSENPQESEKKGIRGPQKSPEAITAP